MAGVISVDLPDGSQRELTEGTTAAELAHSIGSRLAKAAVVAAVNGRQVDLSTELHDGDAVAIVTDETEAGREILRHSTAHVLAQAVLRLWPGAKYAIGPVIENGFYYDFELPHGAHFSDDDLERIEAEMRAIIKEDQPFVRSEHTWPPGSTSSPTSPSSARSSAPWAPGPTRWTPGRGTAAGAPAAAATRWSAPTATPTTSSTCAGDPHVPSTKRLGHFKLMRVAGAYWRGDEKREQLQRIYGTAWETEKALAAYLHQLEEAERRDHRKLGAELDLFSFPEEIGSGLAVFHPKGGTIRRLMEDYSRQRHVEAGYDFVNSPHITKVTPLRGVGPPGLVRRGDVPAHGARRGHPVLPQTDELPVPHPGVPQPSALLPGAAHAALRVRHGLPLREVRRAPGADPGAGHDPGRRPHLLHPRADGRRAGAHVALRLDLLRDYGLNEFYLELSTKPPGKAVGSDEDWEVATEALAHDRPRNGPRARHGRGRRCVLRSEDLGAGPRRHRADLADVDGAAGLPAATALRARVRGGGQRPPPADHDPPGPVRIGGAVHGGAHRALRRRPAHLALPRTGPGDPGDRRPRRLRLVGGGGLPRRPACGPRWTRAARSWVR